MNEKYTPPVRTQEKEPSILDSQQNQLLLFKKLETVYENRVEDLNHFKGSMSGTKYEKEYTDESINGDKQYVKYTRDKIEETNSSSGRDHLDHLEGGFQLSEILQAMIVDRLNKHWFKDCKSIMTSDYDDLKVGIDAIMKHKNGGYLGIAFDFTVTNQDKKIYEKLQKNWANNVEDGNVPTIKYFEDPDTKEKGRLLVPKFIIGASKKDVEELANAYITNNEEILENHPLKYLILLQIEEQLQAVLDYHELNKYNSKLQFAKTQYERIESLLRNIKNEIHTDNKMHENVDLHEYANSSVALNMMRRFRIMREQDSKKK
ncbi:MAG: hypothetical protein WCW65_02345 [Candidatus Paceibacterota bacterium]